MRLICNLALMTGNVGRPGAALLPLRGQNNVQGSSDHGALPDTFTDYRHVSDEAVASQFEQRWGVQMSREPGMKIPEMFDAAVEGSLKAMYIFGEDVAQTDPDTAHVTHALESLEFLVCQEIFETETTKFADVVLPASAFLEKTGTFTNAERRVQYVEAANDPPGAAKTDFEILTTVSRALGHEMGYETPSDVMDEIAEMTPRYAGISHERLGRGGLQWPVSPDGEDTPILYEREFDLPGGRGQFAALPYKPPGDQADDEFPLILVTGRRLEHYNAGTMTRRTGNIELMSSDWLEIHPLDAGELGLRRGRDGHRAQPARADRAAGARHAADRAGARVHRLPLPGGAHQPADRAVGRRQHLVPRVQGRGGVDRAGPRPGAAAGARRRSLRLARPA